MAKGKSDISKMLQSKGPTSLRQSQGRTPVSAVDILDAAAQNVEVELPETEQKEKGEQTNAILPPIAHAEKEIVKSDEIDRTTKSIVKDDAKNRTEKEIVKSDEIDRTTKSIVKDDAKNRIDKPILKDDRIKRSKKPRIYSERDIQSVLKIEKRATERYSFEIYSDQKEDIQRISDLYEAATGKKLSASRLIREVLDSFIPDALKTFDKSHE